MNLPHDIDQLMWTVAESGNATARDDFERRFPELKNELLKRSSMLDGLREARSLHVLPPARPAFRPAAHRSAPFYRGKVALGLSLLAGLALASAGYMAIFGDHPAPAGAIGKYTPRPCRAAAAKAAAQQATIPHYATDGPRSTISNPPAVTNPNLDDARPMRKCMVPQSVSLKQVQLSVAINWIAKNSGLTVEPAPDLPNPTVDVDYKGRGGLEMLKDLGQQYGFTVMEDGENKVLLIPNKTS